jgi:hypothetical protein
MIESTKAKEMYESVSPIYERNMLMQSIFEAIGSEADLSEKQIDDISNQLFPQTATWGLDIWEQRLGLITNHNEELSIRRAKIITKLQSKYIVNPDRMANIIKKFLNADINIKENVAPYIFEIDLLSEEGFPNELNDIYATVKKVKPSHLGVKYKIVPLTKSNLYFGAVNILSEEIIVYPYVARSIETKAKIDIVSLQPSGAENITIYPRKEIN